MLSLGLGYPRAGTAYHVLWFLNQERYITKLPSSSPSLNIQGQGEGQAGFFGPWTWMASHTSPVPDISTRTQGKDYRPERGEDR